jgi:hypothetical protein
MAVASLLAQATKQHQPKNLPILIAHIRGHPHIHFFAHELPEVQLFQQKI